MKKLIIVFTVAFILLVPATFVFAQETDFRKNVVLPKNQTVNHDYLTFGNNVEVAGTVNGDVVVAAGQVLIDGKVNGDVIAAGGQVIINGEVSQNVRVVAGQVSISGKVGRNLSVVGGVLEINDKANLSGSLLAAAGDISLNAPANSDVKVAGRNVVIANRIKRNLDAVTGNLRLTSKASVFGNLNYWSDEKVSLDSGAKIVGSTTQHLPFIHPGREFSQFFSGLKVVTRVMSFVSTFVLALILLLFFPTFSRATSAIITSKPLSSLRWGLVIFIAVPLVSFILFITILAVPLSLILLLLYVLGLYLSRLIMVVWFGREALKRLGQKENVLLTAIAGILVYYLLTLLPFFGGWVIFFAILFGFGSSFLYFRSEKTIVARSKKQS
jgi:hypothetical protein